MRNLSKCFLLTTIMLSANLAYGMEQDGADSLLQVPPGTPLSSMAEGSPYSVDEKDETIYRLLCEQDETVAQIRALREKHIALAAENALLTIGLAALSVPATSSETAKKKTDDILEVDTEELEKELASIMARLTLTDLSEEERYGLQQRQKEIESEQEARRTEAQAQVLADNALKPIEDAVSAQAEAQYQALLHLVQRDPLGFSQILQENPTMFDTLLPEQKANLLTIIAAGKALDKTAAAAAMTDEAE